MPTETTNLLPPPTNPPPCYLCSGPSTRRVTRRSNRNGNAGRPFFKCDPCDKFLVFADERGNNAGNPECHCGLSSKTQVSGLMRRVSRGVHYVCRAGGCDFYQAKETEGGERVVLDQNMLDRLINLKIV